MSCFRVSFARLSVHREDEKSLLLGERDVDEALLVRPRHLHCEGVELGVTQVEFEPYGAASQIVERGLGAPRDTVVDRVAVEQRAIGAGKALVLYPMLVEDRDGDGASARCGVDGEAIAVNAEGLGDEGARLVAGVHGDEAVEAELGEADGAAASGDAVLDGADRVVEPELVVNDDWGHAPCKSHRRPGFPAGRSG